MTRSTRKWVIGGSLGAVGLLVGYEYLQYRKKKSLFLGPGAHEEHEKHGKHKKHDHERGEHEHERGEYGRRGDHHHHEDR